MERLESFGLSPTFPVHMMPAAGARLKWLKRVASRGPRRPPPRILGCHPRIDQTLRSDLFTEFSLRTLAHVGMKGPIAAVRLRDTNLAAL
jgi:hypothetical protein